MKKGNEAVNPSWDFYRVCWIGGFGADQEIDAYVRLRSDMSTYDVAHALLDMGLFNCLPSNGDGIIVEREDLGFKVSAPAKNWGNEIRPCFSLGKQTAQDISDTDYINDEYRGLQWK